MISLLPRAPYLACLPKPTSSPLRMSTSAASPAAAVAASRPRKLPVLLFDVMDTVVRDPFYHHIPAFFQMPMKELLESKHPTAWSDFEMGLIDEKELAKKFFNDGRSFDLEGLKECMVRAYEYIDGVEDILCSLKQNNYEVHAFTNYPVWYQLIEEKLKLSKYLSWTFCSCLVGKRKPSPDFYLHAVEHLNIDPASCIFIDDRKANIEAALSVGMVGLHFESADVLKKDLCSLGVEFTRVHEAEMQVPFYISLSVIQAACKHTRRNGQDCKQNGSSSANLEPIPPWLNKKACETVVVRATGKDLAIDRNTGVLACYTSMSGSV